MLFNTFLPLLWEIPDWDRLGCKLIKQQQRCQSLLVAVLFNTFSPTAVRDVWVQTYKATAWGCRSRGRSMVEFWMNKSSAWICSFSIFQRVGGGILFIFFGPSFSFFPCLLLVNKRFYSTDGTIWLRMKATWLKRILARADPIWLIMKATWLKSG